ncbi:hypothetical protein H7142_00995 [Candidatus Saccharibacteria bacterium]|nr:hypothetical protein [Candidatus Saccharibacteria bacterium]
MMYKTRALGIFAVLFAVAFLTSPVAALTPASNNFRFDESSIGLTNSIESSSANFRDQSTAGGAAAGSSSSTNFQTQIGPNTSPNPNLTFTLNSPAANFGTFSPALASTSTATFSIINYTSFGYVVQIAGKTPTYGTNEIDAMSVAAASQPGIEQFGINLTANTTPSSFGANPVNGTVPNDFGFGQAAPNYATPNQYRYVPGETIAQAPKSSGKTDYTISYLVNVAALTPGGTYGSDQVLIVTGTY